ncbi:MAG: potassium channel family protein [Candidatus Nanopelagicales bacterium]|nr:potassium channel family protein [Candidatus Nanopelagicales bacterium]
MQSWRELGEIVGPSHNTARWVVLIGVITRIREFRARDGLERWERASDWPMAGLALVFLAALLVPLISEERGWWVPVAEAVNLVVWVIFALEFAWRIYLAPRRWHYTWTHPLDVLVVLVPVLRPLRLLRLLAVVGVFTRRAKQGAAGFALGGAIVITIVLVIVSALVVADVEANQPGATIDGFGDGLWWALTTITSVGYGDEYPITLVGREFAAGLMLFGIALIGVVAAAVASWFVRSDRLRDEAASERDTGLQDAMVALSAQLVAVQARDAETRALIRALTAAVRPNEDDVGGSASDGTVRQPPG